MGTRGAAIFADDDASDVKADFRHLLADAQSLEGAKEAIVEDYGASFDDFAGNKAFRLGLGLTQWRMGRLDPRVKKAALADGSRDLDGILEAALKRWWDNPSLSPKAPPPWMTKGKLAV